MSQEFFPETYQIQQNNSLYYIGDNYLRPTVLVFNTETGIRNNNTVISVASSNDIIFSELPLDVINNPKVKPFLTTLYSVYSELKNEQYTYLPLILGEQTDDYLILDWTYETVRISFYFTKERDSYSITRYDSQTNSYSQKIENLINERYKEIAKEVVQSIA